MQIKEKAKNKPKNNNNKLPLPKIKYSNSKNPTTTKIKQINNQPLFHFANNNNIDQYNMIHPNIYQSKEQKQKEDHKFSTKTNIKIKNLYEPKNNYKTYNFKNTGNANTNITSQNNLKYLLKEFGLTEYLRKLYEIGYDNNNYLKIGNLSRKNFNMLLNNINIFPGHIAKMEKFYEYLKKLNNNPNNTFERKRKLNYNTIYGINNSNVTKQNQNKYNHYYNYNSYNINKQSLYLNNNNNNNKNKKCLSPKSRPKTSHMNGFSKPKIKIRNNYSGNKIMKRRMEDYHRAPFLNNSIENNKNSMMKSYLNDNHKFIINHKLNYNKNLLELQKKYNDIEFNSHKSNIHLNANFESNDKQNVLYNSVNNNGAEKQRELEEKINENIEKMLNYYMIQLNDKLDKSYETVEDSSLSYVITSQINESQNNLMKNDNKTKSPNYKLPNINNNININNINHDSMNNNKKNDINNNIIKLKNKFNNKNKYVDVVDVNNINKENEKEPSNNAINIEEKKKEVKNINSINSINSNINIEKKEEQQINKPKEEEINKSKEEKKEIIEEELKKDITKSKEDVSKDIKKLSDHETSTKSKDSKEQQPEDIEEDEFLLKDKKPSQFIQKENPINLKERNDIIKDQPKLIDDSYLLNDKYSLEQNIYDTLRLNRSMDAENTNKDSLKFDIEFMCRCLGLALMKHIEQGKEKQHITELFSDKNQNPIFNFTFFNTDFNNNISLLKDFFKNDKDSKLGDLNMISILEKFYLENGEPDNDDIDFMKHIKKPGDEKIIQKDDIHEETFKLKTGLADFDNEMKFIGEFFSYGRKKMKNYQNLSENTKKILCKDLSYIKEIDSELNKTASIANNTDNNNNSHCNISKSNNNSKFNKIEDNSENNLSKADSKNNQENKTKIIGEEEEKDEEYNNYEDEFIIDDNLIDNNINEEKDNIKNNDLINNDNNKEKEKEKEKEKNNKDILDLHKNLSDKDILDILNDNNKDKKDNKDIIEEIREEKVGENKLISNKISESVNTNEVGTKFDLYKANINFQPISNTEKNSFYNGIIKQENGNEIESDYIIDADNINSLKDYLLKQFEVFDDDFLYYSMNIPAKRFMPPPDPQSIFEFCANIMILTKMEKEVIIISLIYIERLIFNTGFILNSRNWRKIIFISLIIASKLWDDDSLENIHYSQVFTHLKIGEINLLERTFLELINYKIFVKFSEYIKYYLAVKNLALKFNFNGEQIVPVSVEKMMKIQEYAYQMQKRMRKKISLNNSSHF